MLAIYSQSGTKESSGKVGRVVGISEATPRKQQVLDVLNTIIPIYAIAHFCTAP